MVALLLACSSGLNTAESRVDGRTWSSDEVGLALDFPAGWAVATDPQHFRGGLDATLFEASDGSTQLALTWHPVPALGLEQASALDLLHLLAPVVRVRTDERYRLQRLPWCHDVVERRLEGWQQLALRAPGGLVLVQAWSGDARDLVCDGVRWL